VIRSFICYPNLNAKMLSSDSGITAAIDGVTHQATGDIANMAPLPNMHVFVPANTVAARRCVETAFSVEGPVFTRLMRDPSSDIYSDAEEFPFGSSKLLRTGTDITIVAYGDMVFQALEAADQLAKVGAQAEVIDLYSIKSYDAGSVLQSIKRLVRSWL
jgi:transketolase